MTTPPKTLPPLGARISVPVDGGEPITGLVVAHGPDLFETGWQVTIDGGDGCEVLGEHELGGWTTLLV